MKQQLSALIDGEFDIENANHLLLAAKSDGELKQAWVAYHLIGDVMRGDIQPQSDMANRVLAVLDDEPTVVSPKSLLQQSKASKSIFGNTMIWSVAASVAAVMFVGLMLLQHQTLDQSTTAPIEMADNISSEYLAAHQTYAPNSAAYYIQNAAYTEQR